MKAFITPVLESSISRRWLALGTVTVLVVAFLLFRLLRPYSFEVPTPNGYEDFILAASSIAGDVADGADQETLRTFVAQNTEAFALVESGLRKPSRVRVEVTEQWGQRHLKRLAGLKHLTFCLVRKARLAHMEGRTEDAWAAYMQAYRYAHQVTQGGLLVDFLVRIACKTIVLEHFKPIIPDLSAQQCGSSLTLLEETEASEESISGVMGRQRKWEAAVLRPADRSSYWLSMLRDAFRARSLKPLLWPVSAKAARVRSEYQNKTLRPILHQLRERQGPREDKAMGE